MPTFFAVRSLVVSFVATAFDHIQFALAVHNLLRNQSKVAVQLPPPRSCHSRERTRVAEVAKTDGSPRRLSPHHVQEVDDSHRNSVYEQVTMLALDS